MKIGINYGDADFMHTFKMVAELLLASIEAQHSDESIFKNKGKLACIINEVAGGIYIMEQNFWRDLGGYADLDPKKVPHTDKLRHIKNHIHIIEEDIYFDKEVDESICGPDYWWDNCESVVIDTEADEICKVLIH